MKTVIYMANVAALSREKLFGKLYGLMDQERRAKIDSYRFDKDKRLSLGAGVLLEMARRQHGRDIQYNLSHSGELALCAVSNHRIGCDVEQHRQLRDSFEKDITGKIAAKFFYNSEYELIMNQPDSGSRQAMFYRLWTLKESYMKLTGLGFELPLDKFEIGLGQEITLKVTEGYPYYPTSFFEYYDEPDYGCAVAVADYEGNRPELIRVDLDDIL